MSLQVGRVKDISIRLHFTLVITFFLIDWSLSTYFMPGYVKGLGPGGYWAVGSIATGLLFFSILLHELSHSMVARRYGIPVKSITLFIFGGVSDIAREPEDFGQEFKMSIAGPLASFGVAGILALLLWLAGPGAGGGTYLYARGVLFYGALANAALGAFNLIPAFPLDGGRVLRAALVRWRGDYHLATRIATTIGTLVSYVFMGYGLFYLLHGDFVGGIWIILIGWFLHTGAQSYMSQFEITRALRGVLAGGVMNTEIVSVREDAMLDRVLGEFGASMKSELPVVDGRRQLVGMVLLRSILAVPEKERPLTAVGNVMLPKDRVAAASEGTDLERALLVMVQKKVGKIFVCGGDGRLLGVISKTDIMELAGERQRYLQTLGEAAKKN